MSDRDLMPPMTTREFQQYLHAMGKMQGVDVLRDVAAKVESRCLTVGEALVLIRTTADALDAEPA